MLYCKLNLESTHCSGWFHFSSPRTEMYKLCYTCERMRLSCWHQCPVKQCHPNTPPPPPKKLHRTKI